MLLQEFFFKTALKEAGITVSQPYSIDHKIGNNINNGKRYPIIFPIGRINKINNIKSKTKKSYEYYFRGLLTNKKNWILDYKNKQNSLIEFNKNGRNTKIKYNFDTLYYTDMCSSKYTLCPTDVYPWSYRFFEAIMCGSIPVLNDHEIDIFSHKFKFYRRSEKHVYNTDWVDHNMRVFMKQHTLNHRNHYEP